MKTVPAGQFKTQCLSIMDQVKHSGEPVLITKHGQPVAKLVPAPVDDDIFGSLAHKATIVGDVLTSIPPEDWKSE